MTISFTDGKPVTLTDILANRDLRFSRQQQLNLQYHLPLISLTINIPGSIKNSQGSRALFSLAKTAITQMLAQNSWKIIDEVFYASDCGNEQLWVVDHDAKAIKQVCVELEEQHPLGRLWDIDVFTAELTPLSRQNSPRLCLLCNDTAHNCVRARRHSLPQLLAHIENTLNEFVLTQTKV